MLIEYDRNAPEATPLIVRDYKMDRDGTFRYCCSLYFTVITMTNWRSSVIAILGVSMFNSLLHHTVVSISHKALHYIDEQKRRRKERTVI